MANRPYPYTLLIHRLDHDSTVSLLGAGRLKKQWKGSAVDKRSSRRLSLLISEPVSDFFNNFRVQ
jgi:hypothetical protein